MKARLTVELEVPDSFILEGEYENAHLQQFVWDHTVHELHLCYLQRLFEAHCEKDKPIKEALIRLNKGLVDMFDKCQYKIEKINE